MTGRIVRSADFERVLAATAKLRSEHFAVHHLAGCPSQPTKPVSKRSKPELSTAAAPVWVASVDELPPTDCLVIESAARWLGLVVPKRHAKRSVTRSLFKRQIRAAMGRHAGALAGGLWVVRLRAPFAKAAYPSAASTALQRAARAELDGLFADAVRRVR